MMNRYLNKPFAYLGKFPSIVIIWISLAVLAGVNINL